MLAFTMQFSRYGRNRSVLGTPSGVPFGWAVRGKRPNEATASSGPNSVLGTLSVACPRSVAPVKENVLTEQSQESEPNNQCSTRKHGRPATHAVTRGAGAP